MDDTTRLCPTCKNEVTRADEQAGRCPNCGQVLLTLTLEGGGERDK